MKRKKKNKNEQFICHVCGKQFKEVNYLTKHLKIHSEVKIKIKCHECEKEFSRMDSMKLHLETIDKTSRNPTEINHVSEFCQICYKHIENKSYMERHVREVHSGEKRKTSD